MRRRAGPGTCTNRRSTGRRSKDGDLQKNAAELDLDVAAFDRDGRTEPSLERIQRDVDSGLASGQVLGTPTLFIDGVLHRGGYDPPALLTALAPRAALPACRACIRLTQLAGHRRRTRRLPGDQLTPIRSRDAR